MGIFQRDWRTSAKLSLLLYSMKSSHQVTFRRNFHRNNRNHYDALGLTPKASQADIKKAYYKLSLLHHPDKNPGKPSSVFHEISAAYEVLGNLKLRRMYDNGLLTGQEYREPSGASTIYEADASNVDSRDPFKDFGKKGAKVPMSGRTTAFDYDDWSRNHYGTLLQDKLSRKERQERKEQIEILRRGDDQTDIFLLTGLLLLVIASVFTSVTLSSWDEARPKKKSGPNHKNDP